MLSYKQLKSIAVAAVLALGVLAGTNLSAQEQAPQGEPGGGMMGREGMPGGMMDQDGMMARMREMMDGCSRMMQAQASPPAQPPADGAPPQQPRG
jgi:hypothetical protein